MSYVVALEAFHGPLDLLLYMIEESQLDIYDIPVAVITEQYLTHLEQTGDWDLDRLGDFLIMASYLVNLKSRLLLPRKSPQAEDHEESGLDPREELVQKLLAYKNYRQAAQHLAKREQGEIERVFYRELPHKQPEEELIVDVKSLVLAYRSLRNRIKYKQYQVEIPAGDVDIEPKMNHLVKLLRQFPTDGLAFSELSALAADRRELLAYFLALLELLRRHTVKAVQPEHSADIRIYLQVAVKDVNA